MTKLMGLQFQIVYKGHDNVVADALSRLHSPLHLHALSIIQPQWLQEVLNSYVTDPEAQSLLQQLAISSPDARGYSVHQGIIRCGTQVSIGNNSSLRIKLIDAFHASAVGAILVFKGRIKRLSTCLSRRA